MSVQERKARERASRHRSIIAAAREMAEAEGWDAVTTRRLAERIEYSQPVLYSHFRGKDEIIAAVALDGFSEMTLELSRAVSEPTRHAPLSLPSRVPTSRSESDILPCTTRCSTSTTDCLSRTCDPGPDA